MKGKNRGSGLEKESTRAICKAAPIFSWSRRKPTGVEWKQTKMGARGSLTLIAKFLLKKERKPGSGEEKTTRPKERFGRKGRLREKGSNKKVHYWWRL